jgi:phytoene/squalene synthetase
MSSIDYDMHLTRVSRSFAFCIARLEQPLREWVGLTYLLCRLLDTVEDSVWSSVDAQLQAFDEFIEFIETQPIDSRIHEWSLRFEIPSESEKALIDDARFIFQDFHHLPSDIRGPIEKMLKKMATGMKSYTKRKVNGVLELQDLQDVNTYCYYVAGVVGEVLANIMAVVEPKFEANTDTLERAHRFGSFLQKVNLLKDEPEDRPLGRLLVPDVRTVLHSAKSDEEGAIEFIRRIPMEQIGFRLFCAWSLSLGLATLLLVKDPQAAVRKISRNETESLVGEVERRINDQGSLDVLLHQLADMAFYGHMA